MQTATLSTVIDAQVKKAVDELCKRRGIKLRYLVEQALLEQIEDEVDLEDYRKRKNEPTSTLEDILAGLKRKKS